MQAKHVMTTPVRTVSPQASVPDLAKLMLRHRMRGGPMVDDKGRLQGMVSQGDLIRRVASGSRKQRSSWLALGREPSEPPAPSRRHCQARWVHRHTCGARYAIT